ncbi:WYL domain-containing protein [Halioxenophilus sp. WMMB6]|uniref:helix-turn-helix transcriptional regulator n=1 Tax=Halioxenophilus sp. WMMB6 TaxID=3073815 RepID=UPI00295E5D9E|nr:WYL domain-containing protein [Halioxenophilus sp. WMMB6]
MNKLQQIERIHQLFCTRRRTLTLADIGSDLGIAPEAVAQLLEQMKRYLAAPIEQMDDGFQYQIYTGERYRLPEFWLSPSEFVQVAQMSDQIQRTQPGLLQEDLNVLEGNFTRLLRTRKINQYQFERRVRYLSDAPPYSFNHDFSLLCSGLLERRQLAIQYSSDNGELQQLTICPQSLIYRAGAWQLAAWCHLLHQLRSFNVARIQKIELLSARSREIAPKNLDKFFANQLGYNQQQPLTLQLRFWGDSAHQVAKQSWHPNQQGLWQEQCYFLSLPLIDQDQLMARVVSHLPNVQVLSPSQFAERLNHLLQAALDRQQQAKPEVFVATSATVSEPEAATETTTPRKARAGAR